MMEEEDRIKMQKEQKIELTLGQYLNTPPKDILCEFIDDSDDNYTTMICIFSTEKKMSDLKYLSRVKNIEFSTMINIALEEYITQSRKEGWFDVK